MDRGIEQGTEEINMSEPVNISRTISSLDVSARRVMALSFMPEKLDVERQIILEAVCVMPLSVFLLKIVKIKEG